MWPLNEPKICKFNDFFQMVVLEGKCILYKGIKSRTTAIFVIFVRRSFLKVTVSIMLKNANRPKEKFFLFTYFLNFFFAIICHKKSRLFGKISPIFENTCYKN